MPDTVLIFDPDLKKSSKLVELINSHNFRTQIESDAEKLIDIADGDRYLLLVYDAGEVLGNLAFLEASKEEHPNLNAIVVSDESNTQRLANCVNLGVQKIFHHNCDTEDLIHAISQIVSPSVSSYKPITPKEKEPVTFENHPKLHQLVAISKSMQVAIHNLWDKAFNSLNIFICNSEGSENSLILNELSSWKGFQDHEILLINADQLNLQETKTTLSQLTTQKLFSQVVGITNLTTTNLDQQRELLDFIQNGYKDIIDGRSIIYIYFIDPSLLDENDPTLFSELKDLLLQESISFPPLCQRKSDIVGYIQNFLKEKSWGNEIDWSPDAQKIILEYPWPNNHSELMSMLSRLEELHNSNGTTIIDGPTLCQLLRISDSFIQNELSSSIEDFISREKSKLPQPPSYSINNLEENLLESQHSEETSTTDSPPLNNQANEELTSY